MNRDSTDSILDAVRNFFERNALPVSCARVVVGVSGGADSTGLLHILHRLGFGVFVAHVNHGARGEDSDADEMFVRGLAGELGVACDVLVRDVPTEAKAAGVSFETHARAVRYAFFADVAARHGAEMIATAHHADDQAETVLMRIVRGTGPDGLAGIPPVRQMGGLRVVRPLLDCAGADIRAWLVSQSLSWREDASNLDTEIVRNRVRHELLPFVEKEYNPQAREALLRLAEAQRCDNAYWEAQVNLVFPHVAAGLERGVYAAWPEALQRRVLLRWVREKGIEPTHERLLAMAAFARNAPTGDYCDVGGGWQLYSGVDRVLLCQGNDRPSRVEAMPLQVPGETRVLGRVFVARRMEACPAQDLKTYCTPSRQVFDADALHAPLLVRTRRDGDMFAPFGLDGHKKLKDLLIEKGIPAPERDNIPLVLCGDEIVWVAGIAPGQLGAVTANTRRFLEIEVHDALE